MLSHFMRGQVIVMVILAVLYSSAYALLGVRLAVPIGLAAGVLNFIPYLGGAFALLAEVLCPCSTAGTGGSSSASRSPIRPFKRWRAS